MFLFRPVGYYELELIRQLEFKAFPPRLEIQPIFYPVLNENYAVQIASEWNTRDKASGYVGYVTRFEVDDEYLSKFERKIVGAKVHEELWVPSEELDEFNSHMLGKIEVTQAFHSLSYLEKFGFLKDDAQATVLKEMTWNHDESITCHEHCSACLAYLCSEHARLTGNSWQSAYVATHPDNYHWHLCPPCFECLNSEFGLMLVSGEPKSD